MSKKKRRSGHYCKICHEYRSNESFSGKEHANHICKRCSKKSPAEQAADMTLNRINNMPFRKLSQAEKSWLENRLHDQREEVKTAAQEIYKQLYPHMERNNRKKQLHINKLSFRIHAKAFDEQTCQKSYHCVGVRSNVKSRYNRRRTAHAGILSVGQGYCGVGKAGAGSTGD